MIKPPWLQKVEGEHSHLKAFLAPPVPQEALRNMDMVLDYTRVLLEALESTREFLRLQGYFGGGPTLSTIDRAINYKPEVNKHE